MGVKDIQKPVKNSLSQTGNTVAESASAMRGNTNFNDMKPAYHNINAREAKTILDAGEAVTVLDVREPIEYASGHIQNAISLPSANVAQQAAVLLPDKNARILVYCLSGGRSKAAAHQLVRLGYTNVYDFGGIVDWPYGVEIG